MMRVLALVTDAFGGHGGIAQYNRHFLTALSGYPECTELVVLPRLMPNQPEPCPPKLVHVTTGINSKLRYLVSVLRAVISRPHFDIIFCGHIHLLPLAAALRWVTGSRLVLQIHGIEAWTAPAKWFVRILAQKVDFCLAVSRITRRRFLSWARLAPYRCVVLPNTVHNPLFHATRGEPEASLRRKYALAKRPVIMTLGRLEAQEAYKGFDEIIELMPKLVQQSPDLAYVVAGDGNDRARLERKTHSLGVADRVVFTGPVSEEEKASLYRIADAFVMPSRGEGFGIVLLEAMACGTPVVASCKDGGRDALRDGAAGVLVNPDQPEDIAQGILDAVRKPRQIPEASLPFNLNNYTARLHQIMDFVSH